MFVKRPTYVLLTSTGEIQEMFCKVCGTVIGGITDIAKGRRMTRSGDWIEERTTAFQRFRNYAELKMKFKDGSFHVTNGCTSCLSESLTPEKLQELHDADMDLEGPMLAAMKDRVAISVVAVRAGGGII